ncbi:MAG: hypothetical protein VYA30_02505 [Myxococcota bacterium]|nr:hypothetical protein [Myxococcota bacterium]
MSKLLLMVFVFTAVGAQAHKPSFSNGEFKSFDTAWPIQNMATSIVLYHDVTCESDQLWLEFSSVGEEELFVQLGVPVIERLTDYRPSIAILAAGLPPINDTVPFEIPDGLGGIVYHSSQIEAPTDFYEPFSQTESWILLETTKIIEQAGTGYVVAWVPENTTGKLWVAIGTVEDFSDVEPTDFSSWLEQTQEYHETGPYSDTQQSEVSCQPVDEMNPVSAASAGCATAHGHPQQSSFVMLAVLGLIMLRGRQKHLHRRQRI